MPSKRCKMRHSHRFIVIWLSLAAFLHNILMNGSNNVVISSLQKEFYLSSSETGVYVSVYDIGSLISSILIPFAGARGSKPRWIAFGMIMLFTGCMVNIFPHFLRNYFLSTSEFNGGLNKTSLIDESSVELCNYSLNTDTNQAIYVNNNHTIMASSASVHNLNTDAKSGIFSSFQLKHLLYLANFINGLSSASLTALAFSYIEDISPPTISAIYESIYFAVGAFGVGVGFIITSKCLLIHTDIDRGKKLPVWLKPSHPNWIGAWWLPYFLLGFVSLFLAFIIFTFPKKLKNYHHENEKALNEEESPENVKRKPIQNGIKAEPEEMIGLNNNNNANHKNHENHSNKTTSEKLNEDNENEEDSSAYMSTLNTHQGSLMNTLQQTGSILSINEQGYYSNNQNDAENNHIGSSRIKQINLKKNKKLMNLINKSLQLLKNPIYICLIFTAAIEGLLQNSFLAFAPLFIEYQYRLAAGSSSLIIGILSIPPLMFGGLLGGYLVKRFNNKMIPCFKLLCLILFFNLIAYFGFILYCKEPLIIRNDMEAFKPTISDKYRANQFDQDCLRTATNCFCDPKIFKPVCLSNSNDVVFQSPCLAGCFDYNKESDSYSNCTQIKCFQEDYLSKNISNLNETDYFFTNGLCQTESCFSKLVFVYTSIFILMFFNAIIFIPYLKVTIGCVQSKELNSIVLGMKQFFMNAFGTIPGPILFGLVIDSTCKYWHTDSDGQRVCKIYDNKNFALGFSLMGVGFKTCCLFLITLSLIFSIRRKNSNS